MPDRLVLTLSCPDRPGIVHAVSGFLVTEDCNIVESQQFSDSTSRTFFMRVQFDSLGSTPLTQLQKSFADIAGDFDMTWALHDYASPTRVLIMVSKQLHCLNDLLFRSSIGALPIEVVGVVSNHLDAQLLARSYGLAFHHLPADSRETNGRRLLSIVEDLAAELVVMARYMQILPPEVCRALPGRIINIHHSFLPSFKGAKPYHQAHARGVKLIGATAHYATADLDEGPIIEQDVTRVDHDDGPSTLAALGRDVEAQVLARAVGWHARHRVLLNGDRTVVFT
ncbi:MAG TPA: formyltetrahydrofolate deformylase [Mycobacteriales bacterium]|nr:formyltetrahydrofolate deformylase [Mycobacteriales bacterium]